ncbi:uncharacterized protein FA14DRAFT_161386, partial [Meira miltonrushii]
MRCNKVLIAFAFIAIAASVNAAPVDLPLQNVQGLAPSLTSLTNLNSLQGLSPQVLSSLGDGKNPALNLGDLNKQLSSVTQGLPLQSLPVGGALGKTSGLDLSTVNQLLSSGALSGANASPAKPQRRADNGGLGLAQPSQISNQLIGTVTGTVQKAGSVLPTGKSKRDEATTSQSGLVPNTNALTNTITGIVTYPTTLFGGVGGKNTNSVQPQSRQDSGLSPTQVQQITSSIMDSITKFMPMGNTGTTTGTTSGTTSTTGVVPNMRRDGSNMLSGLTDGITSVFTNPSSLFGGDSKKTQSVQPQPRQESANALTPSQVHQITSQILDSINKFVPIGNMGTTSGTTSSTTSGTTSTNGIVPNLRRDDATSQSGLGMVPDMVGLSDSIARILSSANFPALGGQTSSVSTTPNVSNTTPQSRSIEGEQESHKDRRAEDTSSGLSPLQIDQITQQITDSIGQITGGTTPQDTSRQSSSVTPSNVTPNRRADDTSSGLSPLQIDQITKQITDSIGQITGGTTPQDTSRQSSNVTPSNVTPAMSLQTVVLM